MTLATLRARVLSRLGDGGTFYAPAEVNAALNQAQRIFVFYSWCLEARGNLALAADQVEARMLTAFPDFIAPLRVQLATGERLRPGSAAVFAAADDRWRLARATAPGYYAVHGFDFGLFFPAPSGAVTLQVTYARSPVAMALDTDSPEIPEEDHEALIPAARVLLRLKEGGQEFAKELPGWDRFLAAARARGEMTRTRNRAAGYDRGPAEYVDESR